MTTITLTPSPVQYGTAFKEKLNRAFLLFAIFAATLFAGLTISMFTSGAAFADGCDTGGSLGGVGCADTGGNAGGGGGSTPQPNCDDDGCDTAPDDESYGETSLDVNRFTFLVNCSSWGGMNGQIPGYTTPGASGNYKLSSSCTIFKPDIHNTAYAIGGGDPAWRSGGVQYDGQSTAGAMWAWDGCDARGENSAYGKNYTRTVTSETTYIYRVWRGEGAGGSNLVVKTPVKTIYKNNYISGSCAYPEPVRGDQVTCFYNYNGDSHWSRDRGAIRADGEFLRYRESLGSDPRPPVWNGEQSAPQCDRTGSADVVIRQDLNAKGYGYYRLHPTYSYRYFERTDWVGGGRTWYSKWSNPNNGNGSFTNYFAYSCRANDPYEGPFSYGGLPDRNQFFDPATCPQVNWRCELADSTTVGMDRNAIPAGTTKVTTDVTVMRNGEPIPTTFSKVRIMDYTNGKVDVTAAGAGPGVRNIKDIEYQNIVKEGSSPFNGTDPNSSSQFFKLYKTANPSSTNQTEKWNSWLNQNNNNLEKSLSFNWATETNTGYFAAQRQYRVTADFYVPRAGTGDSEGNLSGVGFQWVQSIRSCYEFNSAGQQTNNLLTGESNPVKVVRAVGDPSDN